MYSYVGVKPVDMLYLNIHFSTNMPFSTFFIHSRIEEKPIDLMVKFGERAVAFAGKLPIAQTCEKPSLFLRKHGIVTAEDVYLLLLVSVDIAIIGDNSNTSMFAWPPRSYCLFIYSFQG